MNNTTQKKQQIIADYLSKLNISDLSNEQKKSFNNRLIVWINNNQFKDIPSKAMYLLLQQFYIVYLDGIKAGE